MTAEPIAIIGMSCRLPGGVVDLPGLWTLLSEGRDAIGDIPPDRMDLERHHDATPGAAGKMNARLGGYLPDIDQFDAAFFGIAPREAERIDPQARLMLELAWEALEDAGVNILALQGSQTGVYIGAWTSDFETRLFNDPAGTNLATVLGAGRFGIAGRVSYCLDLRGPSLMVDTACASSLFALHLAVRALREGQCGLALVGAVNLILNPHLAIAFNGVGAMAADGRCKFADATADGYVRSEGAGMVALKPLAAALADGDRIHAVIRGTSIGNDGRASGAMGRPSRLGQAMMLRSAYRDAGVSPAAVGYVEAHGTGTRAGDPVELGALSDVLGEGRWAEQPLLVGSIKTNIGHTEAAAGIAGLIKAALVVRDGKIPRNLHFHTPNPAIPWAEMKLRIVSADTPFPATTTGGVRLAAVSSYGVSGANAHAVMAAPPARDEPCRSFDPDAPPNTALLLPLSARGPAALRALAARYAEKLRGLAPGDTSGAAAICWGAATRRAALTHRAVFVAGDAAGLADALQRFAAGEAAAAVAAGVVHAGPAPQFAFVMPGDGGQFIGMGRQLFAHNQAFRNAILACDAAVQTIAGWSIAAELNSDTPDLDRMDIRQPLLCALSIAYAAALQHGGVQPAAIVGHSMGEVAAAAVAGVLDVAAAMRVICHRSALMQPAVGQGAMALVEQQAVELQTYLDKIGAEARGVVIAAVNGPRTCVISGDPASVQAVSATMLRDGIFCRPVKVDLAAHSPQMDGPAAALGAALAGLAPSPACVPIYSTVYAGLRDGTGFDSAYWVQNMRQPVRFYAAVRAMAQDGINGFIELGAHPVLLGALQQTLPDAIAIASGRREQQADLQLLSAFGALWAAGRPLEWRHVIAPGLWVDLPLYPWQRERHWADAAGLRTPQGLAEHLRLDNTQRGWIYHLDWQPNEPAAPAADVGRWLVLGEGPSAAALAAELTAATAPIDAWAGALTDITDIAVLVPDNPDAAFLPLRVLQTVLRAGRSPRLWFITAGGQAVAAAERVSIDLAASWGAARAISEEHPSLWGGLADIDQQGVSSIATLARHLRAGDGQEQAAFRAGRRFVPRLLPAPPPATPYAWRPDGAYLVTGGLGGVALHVARRAARSGARRLILVGRTALPPRESWAACPATSPHAAKITAIRELEALGVAVHLAPFDIADEAALRGFLDGYRAQGWPPIRGVLHAAASAVPMLAGAADPVAFAAAMAAKLHGARLLDRLLPELDLFALFSSVTALLPHAGVAPYAAANAGLDGLAQDRRARGLPAVSIAWGLWDETGLAVGAAGAQMARELGRIGLSPLPPTAGAEVFAALCGNGRPYYVVTPADWAAFRRGRAGRPAAMFAGLIPAETHAGADLPTRLAAATTGERRGVLLTLVRDALARVLKLPVDRLDDDMLLGDLGVSSLLSIELRNVLEGATGLPLPATLVWNHPTITAIVGRLERSFMPAEANHAAAPSAPVSVTEFADLNDDEALQMLMTPS